MLRGQEKTDVIRFHRIVGCEALRTVGGWPSRDTERAPWRPSAGARDRPLVGGGGSLSQAGIHPAHKQDFH